MNVKVLYADTPEEFIFDYTEYTASEIKEECSDLQMFRNILNNPNNYATLENNKWLLDGTYETLNNNKIPFWSVQVSNDTMENGKYYFNTPIQIDCVLEKPRNLSNLTVITDSDCYCNYLKIQWYLGENLVEEREFNPNTNIYECSLEEKIEFNKVSLTFYSMNKPNRYLKLFGLVQGKVYEFGNEQIADVYVLNEISILCTELPAHSIEINFKKSDFQFTRLNPLLVSIDNISYGTFYIDTVEILDNYGYNVQGYNFIQLLEYYTSNPIIEEDTYIINALKENILGKFPLQYTLDESYKKMRVYDYINFPNEFKTTRDWLLMFLSSLGSCYTIKKDSINIDIDFNTTKVHKIQLNQIFSGAKIIRPTEKYNIVLECETWLAGQGSPHSRILKEADFKTTYEDPEYGTVYKIETFSSIPAVNISLPQLAEKAVVKKTKFYVLLDVNKVISFDIIDGRMHWDDASAGSVKNKIILNTPNYSRLTIKDIIIKSFLLVKDSVNLQKKRAQSYYKNDITFEGTINLKEKIECGDWIEIESDKYDNFKGVVDRIEYVYKGGQKIIGRVRAHAYG